MPINPAEWLAAAEQIIAVENPTEAMLRRAVSSAYYAVFHHLLKTGSDRLIGVRVDSAYRAVYRRFEHGRMKELCKLLNRKDVTSDPRSAALGIDQPSDDVRTFASGFIELQEKRHEADYDPGMGFQLLDCRNLVDLAGTTIAAFDRIPAQFQNVILLYMYTEIPKSR